MILKWILCLPSTPSTNTNSLQLYFFDMAPMYKPKDIISDKGILSEFQKGQKVFNKNMHSLAVITHFFNNKKITKRYSLCQSTINSKLLIFSPNIMSCSHFWRSLFIKTLDQLLWAVHQEREKCVFISFLSNSSFPLIRSHVSLFLLLCSCGSFCQLRLSSSTLCLRYRHGMEGEKPRQPWWCKKEKLFLKFRSRYSLAHSQCLAKILRLLNFLWIYSCSR